MESAATLSWLWIIETLADLKQADLPLLRALISKVPDFLTDASEAVRERVAMRYLEECMGSGRADVPSTTSPGPRINAARSSEEVLSSHFMKVANLGSLEKCGNELSSQDLHQFILQKRAALPKSAIDLLRDSILGHCPASIVLNGSSGLSRPCQVDNLQCNDDGEHEHVNMLKFSTVDSEFHSQIPGSIILAPNSTNLDLQEEPFRTENDLPKQSVSYVDSRNHLQRDIATTGGNDVLLLEKGSTDQLPGEKTIGLNDGKIQLVNQASTLPVDSGSVSLQDPAYRKQLNEQSVSDCERRNNVQFSRHSSVSQPSSKDNISLQQAPVNGSGKNVNRSLCKSAHFDGDLTVIPDTPGNDGSDDVPSNFVTKDEMFTAEKHHLLNSQIHANHDSIAGDRSKQGLCIKCDKDGQLLSCSAKDCLITVHESCLGPSFNFNETELFYCPFCSYARATSAYCEARKNLFQATKALSAFTGEILVQGDCMELTLATISGETNPARAVGNMNYQHTFYSHEHCRNKSNGNVLEEKEHQTEVVNVCYKGNSSGRFSEAPPINAMRYVSHNTEESNLVEAFNDNQDITQVQQHTAKTMNNGRLPYGDKVSTPTAVSKIHQPQEPFENPKRKKTSSGSSSKCVLLKNQEQNRAGPDYEDDWEGLNSESNGRHAKRARNDAPLGMTHHPQETVEKLEEEKFSPVSSKRHVAQPETVENLKEEKFSSVNSKRRVAQPESVENLKEEKFSSVISRRRVAQPKPPSNQRITPGRREKIFWTSEEEETLKSAGQRFADSDGNYPWRKILEFGRNVFHATRQPGDLKDKWRNIMKKEVKQ